jgi:glycine cleavage system H lipoate-binding protein/ABC-type phosphate transport system substrate-binding protein
MLMFIFGIRFGLTVWSSFLKLIHCFENLKISAMKNKNILNAVLLMALLFGPTGITAQNTAENKVSVLTTSNLNTLSKTLIEEYSSGNTETIFQVKSAAGSDFDELMKKDFELGFTSGKANLEVDQSFLKLLIGREIVVPVINAQNPFLDEIETQGISAALLSEILTGTEPGNWGTLLRNNENSLASVYVANDASAFDAVASFTELKPSVFKELTAQPASELIKIIQENKYAIGFCRLTDALNSEKDELIAGIRLLPIDRNGNNAIDFTEKIYGSLSDFRRGVWIGKHPGELVSNIYTIMPAVQQNETVTDFVSWVLTDGQQFIENSGYNELVANEKPAKLNKLQPQQLAIEPENESKASHRAAIFIIAFFAGIGLLIFVPPLLSSGAEEIVRTATTKMQGPLTESTLRVPEGLYFDKTHTWVYMERDGTVKMGIDDFLQRVAGTFTRIKMKNPGEKIKKNDPVMTLIQNGKQIVLYAPVSGIIRQMNESLIDKPSVMNSSPFKEGWVYAIEPANWLREIKFLKMAKDYREWIKGEFTRLRDFFAEAVHSNLTGHVIYQDGGEFSDAVLQDLAPEVWEDFQKHFIDASKL